MGLLGHGHLDDEGTAGEQCGSFWPHPGKQHRHSRPYILGLTRVTLNHCSTQDNSASQNNVLKHSISVISAIYAPMIYTTMCIMFLMRADPLPGQAGGVGPWKLRFFWALGIKSIGECHLRPKQLEISRVQPPPTCPSSGSDTSKIIMYRDVQITA